MGRRGRRRARRPRYVRSDVGARMAVDVAVETDQRPAGPATPAIADLLRAAAPLIVERLACRGARAHRGPIRSPTTRRRRRRHLAGRQPRRAYGATLLLGGRRRRGRAARADRRRRRAGPHARVRRRPGPGRRPADGERDHQPVPGHGGRRLPLRGAARSAEPDLVLLATDGYGNSFAARTGGTSWSVTSPGSSTCTVSTSSGASARLARGVRPRGRRRRHHGVLSLPADARWSPVVIPATAPDRPRPSAKSEPPKDRPPTHSPHDGPVVGSSPRWPWHSCRRCGGWLCVDEPRRRPGSSRADDLTDPVRLRKPLRFRSPTAESPKKGKAPSRTAGLVRSDR